MAVLTNAIDTEGNLPEELTAQLKATIKLKGHEPIALDDTFSGPRYTGPMGAAALFSPIASIVNILVRNPMAPVRIESIDCDVEIEPGPEGRRRSSRSGSLSDTLEPGQTLKAFVTLKPFKGERADRRARRCRSPPTSPKGRYEAVFCDMTNSLRRRFRNEPAPGSSRATSTAFIGRSGSRPSPSGPRSTCTSRCPSAAWPSQGQALPNLPGSVRAVFAIEPADPTTRRSAPT